MKKYMVVVAAPSLSPRSEKITSCLPLQHLDLQEHASRTMHASLDQTTLNTRSVEELLTVQSALVLILAEVVDTKQVCSCPNLFIVLIYK